MSFNCPKCGTQMKIRKGKYGEFYYCPKGKHGTISVAMYNEIMAMIPSAECVDVSGNDPLMKEIERQTVMIGGVMSDTERMMVDTESFYDNPTDYWLNYRPY